MNQEDPQLFPLVSLASILLTQLLTIIGLAITHRHSKRLITFQKQFELQLEDKAKQLSEFYGPLHLLFSKSQSSFTLFTHLQQVDREAANKVLNEVLDRMNKRITRIIESKSHLMDPRDEIGLYTTFLLHAETLSARIANPGNATLLEHIAFPKSLPALVAARYNELKQRPAGTSTWQV